MPQCSCDLGYQVISQGVSLPASGQGTQEATLDLSIPTGKIVTGSGGQLTSVNGARADPSNPYWASAIGQCEIQSGPHPSDASKWRFSVSARAGDGAGLVVPVTIGVWMAVLSA